MSRRLTLILLVPTFVVGLAVGGVAFDVAHAGNNDPCAAHTAAGTNPLDLVQPPHC